MNDQRDTVDRARDPGERIVCPTMALGEFDRLFAALGAERYRIEDRDLCQMRESAEFEKRTLDPPRERERSLEVSLRRVKATRPQLGDAELQQRKSSQVVAEPCVPGVGCLGGSKQPMRLLHDRLKVAAVAGDREPGDRQHKLQVTAGVG